MLRRFEAITDAGYPYFVAELDGRVVGYAYANAYRTRPAYRFTVENSVYIAPDAQGKGIGRVLLAALIDTCTAQGFRLMVAVIGDSGELRLHHPAPPRRLQVLRHDPLRRLQVRPLARQRRHGAAPRRGRHVRTRRTIRRDRVRALLPVVLPSRCSHAAGMEPGWVHVCRAV